MITTIILPNYNQVSQLSVLSCMGTLWKKGSYNDDVSTLGLPKGCGRGIPAPVLARQSALSSFVLGQLVCQANNKAPHIFMKSCLAGKDRTGRSVFLTVIWSGGSLPGLQVDTEYSLPINAMQIKEILGDDYDLSENQEKDLNQAINLISFPPSESEASIRKMWRQAENRRYLHYASVDMSGAGYLPDSQKIFQKKNERNLFSNTKNTALIGVIFLLLFIFILSHCSSNKNNLKKNLSSEPVITQNN